jgi:hypothetical protein
MNDSARRVLATMFYALADVAAAIAKETAPKPKPRKAAVPAWVRELRDVRE